MRITHPQFERLVDYAEAQPDAPEWAALAQHVNACRRCAADLAWLRHTVAEMRADDTEQVPGELIRRLLPLFDRRQAAAAAASSGGIARRLIGLLRLDTGAALTPAFGFRGSEPAGRQLVYTAAPFEVDLRAEPEANGWALAGQLLGPAASASGLVELVGPASRTVAPLSELLEFSLPPVAAGVYRLDIRLADNTSIEIAPIELEARTD